MTDQTSDTLRASALDLFLKNLRAATGPMHERLEANPVSTSLMRPDVSLQTYQRYLLLMGEVISFCEKTIFPALSDLVDDIAERGKLAHIHADLHYLDDGRRSQQPVLFYPLTGSLSIPFALGYMYVIEGSTLGGRIILKHIHTALGLDENKGASFFAGYGAETGIRWKKIMNIMSGYAVANKCEDEVIAGACHAFESIDKYFALNSSVHED